MENSDDAEEAALIQGMADKAREYIQAYEWCPPITRMSLGDGVGGVIALFRVEFARAIEDTDRELWVVVGDVPSAYFVYEGNEEPDGAFEQYCLLMEDWANAVRAGGSLDEVFPVDAPTTQANADSLLSRIAFIREELIGRPSAES